MILTEESCGTNAVDMSIILKKPVYTLPNHHYCEFLRELHLYSIPLIINEGTIGYLALASAGQLVSKELIIITDLLSYQVINELRIRSSNSVMCVDSKIKLSCKQLSVLKLMARGMTDKSIALEMELSFDTVRCHKKFLFRKLGVNCSVEAVVKALKLNLISIDQIVS